jgi:hypothetical protein
VTKIKQVNSDTTVVWWGGINASVADNVSTPFIQYVALTDSSGTVITASNAFPVRLPTPSTNYRAIGSLTGNVKGSAGVLWSVSCTNLNASTRYLHIFDSTGAPSGSPLEVTQQPPQRGSLNSHGLSVN